MKNCSECKFEHVLLEEEPCLSCVWCEQNKSNYTPNTDTNCKTESQEINTTKTYDNVSTPYHYNTGSIEVIEYIADQLGSEVFYGVCVANVIKYVSRYKHKNGKEDIKKAKRYLEFMLNVMEGRTPTDDGNNSKR